jgi:hypothetical protein
VTADEFRDALAALGHTQRGFAAFTGSNDRTVRRWALGEQDIPPWVPVMLGLMGAPASTPASGPGAPGGIARSAATVTD